MKLLQIISWKIIRFHLDIKFLNFYINNEFEQWGIDFLNISHKKKIGSLCRFIFVLPNGGSRNAYYWEGDLFFLKNVFLKQLDELQDHKLWNSKSFTKFKSVKYKILMFILD